MSSLTIQLKDFCIGIVNTTGLLSTIISITVDVLPILCLNFYIPSGVAGEPLEKRGMTMRRLKTRDLLLCALFVSLITIGTFIRVPVPVVPFTLQFLFTTMAGLLLGGPLGAAAVCTYIALGLLGLPVFAAGGGIAYVLQPTFGYLIGFALGAYVTGTIANRRTRPSMARLLIANGVGLLIVYGIGMLYCYLLSNYYLGTPLGVGPLFLYCFVLAVPGDMVLCGLAAVLAKRLLPALQRREVSVA